MEPIAYTFTKFETPENEDRVARIVALTARFFPHWVADVQVYEAPQPENQYALAQIEMLPPYRQIGIAIYPQFYIKPWRDQVEAILHEFTHAITGAYAHWHMEGPMEFIKERHPEVFEVLARQAQSKMEEITCDLTHILFRQLPEHLVQERDHA